MALLSVRIAELSQGSHAKAQTPPLQIVKEAPIQTERYTDESTSGTQSDQTTSGGIRTSTSRESVFWRRGLL